MKAMEENHDQPFVDPEVVQTRKHLQQFKHLNTMNRREKSEFMTKELLQTLTKLLNIKTWQNSHCMVPIEVLLQDLHLLVNCMFYEQMEANEAIAVVHSDRDQHDLYVVLEGTLSKQFICHTMLLKLRKQSTVPDDKGNHGYQGQKKKLENYRASQFEMPPIACPTNQTYKLKAVTPARVVRIEKSGLTIFCNTVEQQEREHTNYFLSKWLHIDTYYIKNFKIEAFTQKELIKRRQSFNLGNHCLYIVGRGTITISSQRNACSTSQRDYHQDIAINKGSIINLDSLFTKNREAILVSVENQAYLIKIEKEPLLKIMEENPWVAEEFQAMTESLSDFRNWVSDRLPKVTEPSPQKEVSFQNLTLSKSAMQNFRRTIGMKRFPNRFRLDSTNPDSAPKQTTSFISSFYPFARMVESEDKIASRNAEGRSKKVEINMLPEKDSKNFVAMKRRIHDEKVKKMRVRKRAEQQIRESSFLNKDLNDKRIMDLALFHEHLHIPNFQTQFVHAAKKEHSFRVSSTFRKGIEERKEQMISLSGVENCPPSLRELVKYKLPIRLERRLTHRIYANFRDLNSSKSNLVDQSSLINLNERIQRQFSETQHNRKSRTPEMRIIKKMASGKLRKVKVACR